MHGAGVVPSCLPRFLPQSPRSRSRKRPHNFASWCGFELFHSKIRPGVLNSPRPSHVGGAWTSACYALKAARRHALAELLRGGDKKALYRLKSAPRGQQARAWFSAKRNSQGDLALLVRHLQPQVRASCGEPWCRSSRSGTRLGVACAQKGLVRAVDFNPRTLLQS